MGPLLGEMSVGSWVGFAIGFVGWALFAALVLAKLWDEAGGR